jgi:hypothetical protein
LGPRLLAGIAVQPFLAGGLAFVSFPMLLLDRSGGTLAGGFPSDATDAAFSVAIGAGIVALLVSVAGVLPTVIWVTRRRHVALGEALLFGLGFGNLPFVVGTALAGVYGVGGFVRGAAFSSLLGLAGAGVFWVIALREPEPGNNPPGR